MPPLSLRWNLSWIAAGNAVELVCQWGMVVVLAHLGDLEMIGMVVLAFAICAPVNALTQLGLRGAVVTDARREYRFADYLALRIVTATLALLIVVAVVLATGYARETAWIILAVGLAEMIKSISDIFHAGLQQRERMDRIAVSLMIRGPVTLILLTLAVYATGNIAWGILAFPLVAAATLFGHDVPNGFRIVTQHGAGLKPRFHARTMLKLAWLTLPLGIVLMLIALSTSIPRYLVDLYLGKRALGVFVSILYLGVVGARVVAAVSQSAGPRLAKYYAEANTAAYCRLLAKLLAPVVGLGAAVVLVVWLAGGPILGLLYDADYAPYLDLGVLLMVAAAAMYLTIPLGIAVEAMRRFKTHMVIRAMGIVVLLALLPGFIEAYQLPGAAVAMLISSACSVLGCLGVVLWSLGRGLAVSDQPSAISSQQSARAED